jgi:hypothetical protein
MVRFRWRRHARRSCMRRHLRFPIHQTSHGRHPERTVKRRHHSLHHELHRRHAAFWPRKRKGTGDGVQSRRCVHGRRRIVRKSEEREGGKERVSWEPPRYQAHWSCFTERLGVRAVSEDWRTGKLTVGHDWNEFGSLPCSWARSV